MFIDKVISGDLIEEGVWAQLEFNGEPYFLPDADGKPDPSKPVRVKVRSRRSKVYRTAERGNQAKAIVGAKGKPKSAMERTSEALESSSTRYFSVLLIATENFDETNPRQESPTDKQKLEMASQSKWQPVVDQVWAISGDDAQFAPEEPVGNVAAGGEPAPPQE